MSKEGVLERRGGLVRPSEGCPRQPSVEQRGQAVCW